MKQMTKKQSDWIRFTILMVCAAIIYGINLAFNAGYVNRWVALALTIVLTGGTFWGTREKLWKRWIKDA